MARSEKHGAQRTIGSLVKTSALKMGTLDMNSVTAAAPAPPQIASAGAHLNAADGVLLNEFSVCSRIAVRSHAYNRPTWG